MHRRMDTLLKRLRQDIARRFDPESILAACRSVGHSWRNTTLNPVGTFRWFVTQILHGNTSLEHVSLLGGRLFTGSAHCQARARLPLIVFREVLRNLVKSLVEETRAEGLWRGHRPPPGLWGWRGRPGRRRKSCENGG